MTPQRHRELVGKGWWAGQTVGISRSHGSLQLARCTQGGPPGGRGRAQAQGPAGLELRAGREARRPPNRGGGGLPCGVRTPAQQVTGCAERPGMMPAAALAAGPTGRGVGAEVEPGRGGPSRKVCAPPGPGLLGVCDFGRRGSPGRGSWPSRSRSPLCTHRGWTAGHGRSRARLPSRPACALRRPGRGRGRGGPGAAGAGPGRGSRPGPAPPALSRRRGCERGAGRPRSRCGARRLPSPRPRPRPRPAVSARTPGGSTPPPRARSGSCVCGPRGARGGPGGGGRRQVGGAPPAAGKLRPARARRDGSRALLSARVSRSAGGGRVGGPAGRPPPTPLPHAPRGRRWVGAGDLRAAPRGFPGADAAGAAPSLPAASRLRSPGPHESPAGPR